MKRYRAMIGGKTAIPNVKRAENFFTRFMGLMGKKRMDEDEGLLIRPCRQIHTFFMRFPIDAVFLSDSGQIVWLEESMTPRKVSRFIKDGCQVLELKGGTIRKKSITLSSQVTFSVNEEGM